MFYGTKNDLLSVEVDWPLRLATHIAPAQKKIKQKHNKKKMMMKNKNKRNKKKEKENEQPQAGHEQTSVEFDL